MRKEDSIQNSKVNKCWRKNGAADTFEKNKFSSRLGPIMMKLCNAETQGKQNSDNATTTEAHRMQRFNQHTG
jgi:hypothetical protein